MSSTSPSWLCGMGSQVMVMFRGMLISGEGVGQGGGGWARVGVGAVR